MLEPTRYNTILLLVIAVLCAAIEFRLFEVAIDTDNWRGFFYSSLHVAVVATGSYFAIRRKST